MNADQRTRLVTLLALSAMLAAVLAWQFWPAAASRATAKAAPVRAGGSTAAAAAVDPRELDVRLDALRAQVPEPRPAGRDPFGFRAAPPPPSPPPLAPPVRPGNAPAQPGAGGGDAGPPPPAPPPPITLKFIGLIVEGPGAGKIAVLSDGRFVFRGREGDIIEGRYRVVRIGDESLQMEHVDGRGRQTIRLSGS